MGFQPMNAGKERSEPEETEAQRPQESGTGAEGEVGSAQSVGTTHVIVSATDAAGNVGTLSFDVTVSDGTPPAITSTPANRSLAADANGKAVLPNLIPELAATDNVERLKMISMAFCSTKERTKGARVIL